MLSLRRGMRLIAVFLGGTAANVHGTAGLDGVALLQVPLKQRAAVNTSGGEQAAVNTTGGEQAAANATGEEERWPQRLVPTRVVHPDWVPMPRPQELADQIPVPPAMKRLMKSASPELQQKAVNWYRLGRKVQGHLVRIGAEMSFDDAAHGNLARNLLTFSPTLQGPDPLARLQLPPAPGPRYAAPRYAAPYYPPSSQPYGQQPYGQRPYGQQPYSQRPYGQQPLYGRRMAQSPTSQGLEDDEGPAELYPPQILQDSVPPGLQRNLEDLPTTVLAAHVKQHGGRRHASRQRSPRDLPTTVIAAHMRQHGGQHHASRQAREEEAEIERLEEEDDGAMRDYEATSRGGARSKSKEWLEEMQQQGEEEDLLEDVLDADALEYADA